MRQQIEQTLSNFNQQKQDLDDKNSNTRRNKRNQKELDEWKAKLTGAAGKNLDFDKITSGKFDPKEMEESMLGIASEIEPTLQSKKKKGRYGYDPVRGEKVRLDKPKVEKESKT